MNNYILLLSLISIIFFLPIEMAWSHTRLKVPTPRSSNAGIKSGPCGVDTKQAPVITVLAGSQLEVSWEETVQHPGWFELNWSKNNDSTFSALPNASQIVDTQDGGGLPHQYTFTVAVPNEACDNCTLQLVQMMTEDPMNPSPYFSCADIKVELLTGDDTLNEKESAPLGTKLGGCATIDNSSNSGGPSLPIGMLFIFFAPILFILLKSPKRQISA